MATPPRKNQNRANPVLETRRQVMSAVITAFPGGRESAAARLGLPLKKLDNHLYENAGSQPLTDAQVHQLEQQTGTAFLPDYICNLYGGVFVAMPERGELDNLELYARSLSTTHKRGLVDQLIAQSLDDGVIDEAEVQAILAAHRKHIAARHSEVAAVIVLHSKASE
ncbi:YmfL family putative regulatory protein [Phytopseudomonas daroniae]|uniref:YmfL family putative regulatory protein n=1 Tax=Phytopseudomonas daroniae TaxID=2487519 RepID=UPI001ABF2D92|nr:YmfL family putative regulatory protein [Pseudomonas daroniae]